MDKYLNLNPLVLAFVGDAVYTELVRTYLVENEPHKVNDLHKSANKFVCCEFQAKVLDEIFDSLTEEEKNIAMRARNAKKNTTPKHGEKVDYAKSTSLEAVIGYNHLRKNTARVNQILDIVLKGISK